MAPRDVPPRILRLARALEHPLRLQVFFAFDNGISSPSRVARHLDEPLNLVAYHTSVLLRYGCIEATAGDGEGRRREHHYTTIVTPRISDDDWMALPPRLRRALTRSTLTAMVDSASRAATAGGFDGPHAHLSRTPLLLDDQGLEVLSRTLQEVCERAHAERAAKDDQRAASHELLIMLFAGGLSPRERA
jgi:hypothetical protein